MILVRSPLRISFVGGGSDMPQMCDYAVGAVVSATISHSVYISIVPRDDRKIRLSYSNSEMVDDIDDIRHDIIRESLKHFRFKGIGLEITSTADLPHGMGLGSSGAFTVGLVQALLAIQGRYIPTTDLYFAANIIEIERCNKNIGYQDQAAATVGGMNMYEFHKNGWLSYESIAYSRYAREFEDRLLLVDTGTYGLSADVIDTVDFNDKSVSKAISSNADMCREFRNSLALGYFDLCGEMVDHAWQLKKKTSPRISNDRIDHMYDFARKKGAIGGKLCGAGGRGAFLIIAEKNKKHSLAIDIHEEFGMTSIDPFLYPQGSAVVYSSTLS